MDFLSNLWTQIPELVAQFGSNVLGALVIFFIGYQIAKLLRRIAQKALAQANFDPTLGKFAINLVYYAMLAFVIMASLDQLGVDTNSFIAVIGAAGLAAGLAMEGALANFAAGVILIWQRPFKIGDYVEIADIHGQVEDIAIVTTRIVTFENETVILPNRDITDGKIINYSSRDFVELELSFFVDFTADLNAAVTVLQQAADASPFTIKEPVSAAYVYKMHPAAVELMLEANILPHNRENATFDLNRQVMIGFQKQGITMPQQRWMQNPSHNLTAQSQL